MINRIKIIATGALLLTASSAMAGLISSPLGLGYASPELTPVDIQNLGEETFRIHTSRLTGELTIEGSDFPPEYDIATTEKVVLPFDQDLELVIDLTEGAVSGSSTVLGFVALGPGGAPQLTATAEVRGNATCLPLNGRECGQLVMSLELRGVLSDPNDPSIIGKLRMEMLASLIVYGDEQGIWAAISANATLGGNEALIKSLTGLSKGDITQK